MIYPKYGFTFKRIREQKQLSLSSFNQAGISKPALSKFERGLSMMSFESVVRGLQEMNVTLEEFEHFLNDYSMGDKEALLKEIEEAALNSDVPSLTQLHHLAHETGFPYLAFAAKATYTMLSDLEAEKITEFLYDLDIWGYTELAILYFTMEQIHPRDILHLLNFFLDQGHEIFNSEKHREHFIQVACRAVTVLTTKGYKDGAGKILRQLDNYKLVQTMFQRNLKNMTEGFWLYTFIDEKKGDLQMQQGLEILQHVSSPQVTQYYQKRYNMLVIEEQEDRKANSVLISS